MGSEGRLRVCMAIPSYPPSFAGHGIQLQRNLPYLEARGVDPTVLTGRTVAPMPPARDEDRVRRVLPVREGLLGGLQGLVAFRRFFQRHARDYDVVHAVGLGPEFFLNLPALKRAGLPVVFEMVLLGSDDPTTIGRYRLGKLQVGLARRHVDLWSALSGAFLPSLEAAGIPRDRCRVIYSGVDTSEYRPRSESERRELRARLELPAEGRVVVSVGSLLHRKGMDRLLEAWACSQPVVGRDVLLVVGPTREAEGLPASEVAHSTELQRRAQAPDLAGTVRFEGRREGVVDYMAVADLFALLSRREGLGAVILEALASGVPCLVSPLDGIGAEVLAEGETGFVVPEPDDAERVGKLLSSVLADPERRAAMGRAGRIEAERRFSMEARADALSELYRRAIEVGPASGRR